MSGVIDLVAIMSERKINEKGLKASLPSACI